MNSNSYAAVAGEHSLTRLQSNWLWVRRVDDERQLLAFL